jgi:putative DNA primase/helicase
VLREAVDTADDEERKELVAWWKASESRRGLEAMIALAASEEGIPVQPDWLNSNPWLLNTKNGTIDLQSGRLHPHRRDDLISSLVPVAFDPPN